MKNSSIYILDNIKDFILLCSSDENEEIIKLRIKNMPDSEERETIFYIEEKVVKKVKRLNWSFVWILLGSVSMVQIEKSIFWIRSSIIIVCAYIVYLFLAFYVDFCRRILRRYYVKKKGCIFLYQYLKAYSDEKWYDTIIYIERIYSLLNLCHTLMLKKTLGETLLHLLTDFYLSIFLSETYIKLTETRAMDSETAKMYGFRELSSSVDMQLYIENIIYENMLEEDIVEYDFLKRELRVPENLGGKS